MNQLKTVIWGAALVLLCLIGGTGWLLYERIESTVAPQDVRKMKEDLNHFEVKQKQQGQEIEDTKSRVAVLEGNVRVLKDRDTEHDKQINETKSQVKVLEGDVKALKEKGEATEASVKDIQAQIVEKEKRIAELERERDKMKQEMQGMQKDIDEIKKALGLKSPN